MDLQDGTPEQAGFKPDRLKRVSERAASWVADGKTPSLVVLAARRGVIALHEAFGTLTHESDSPPLAIDSVFPVSSIAKPATATAIMLLVEDGLLGLARPVVDYIPELTGKGAGDIPGASPVEPYVRIRRRRRSLAASPAIERPDRPVRSHAQPAQAQRVAPASEIWARRRHPERHRNVLLHLQL